VGYAYAGPWRTRAAYAWSLETSVYLAPSACGRGLGRALMKALLALLRLQGFRLARASAGSR
jgi:phosphinothricin acetyltransferase